MKSMINRLKLQLFGIKSERPQQSVLEEKTSFTTTMPTDDISYDEWQAGKWSDYLWKQPNFKY